MRGEVIGLSTCAFYDGRPAGRPAGPTQTMAAGQCKSCGRYSDSAALPMCARAARQAGLAFFIILIMSTFSSIQTLDTMALSRTTRCGSSLHGRC